MPFIVAADLHFTFLPSASELDQFPAVGPMSGIGRMLLCGDNYPPRRGERPARAGAVRLDTRYGLFSHEHEVDLG